MTTGWRGKPKIPFKQMPLFFFFSHFPQFISSANMDNIDDLILSLTDKQAEDARKRDHASNRSSKKSKK